MGSRTIGLSFPITEVLDSAALAIAIADRQPGELVAIDEAQYFTSDIVSEIVSASKRGVDFVLGMPSPEQLERLASTGAAVISPDHTADICQFHDMLKTNPPFPGELHAYQPFYGLNFDDFTYVRNDCPERLRLMLHSCRKSFDLTTEPPFSLSYLDVGCCSGYFVEGMASAGFQSTGVDVQKFYVEMARALSEFRGSGSTYILKDAYDFSKGDERFDVVSSFATIQWVMTQRGYSEGFECLINLMSRTRKLFVLEMGYTSEDIYKGKIDVEIDRKWTADALRNEGGFAHVTRYDSGKNGLWRDVFIASR